MIECLSQIDSSMSGREVEDCKPVDAEGVTSGSWIVECKSEAGVSWSDAGLEGIFEGEEIENETWRKN